MGTLLTIADSAGEAKDPADIDPTAVDGVLTPIDGLYVWEPAILAKFKGKLRFTYTVFGDPAACVFDIEAGCCTVPEAANGILERRAKGASSIVYCSTGDENKNWATLYDDLTRYFRGSVHLGPPTNWWVANYLSETRPETLPVLGQRVRAMGLQYWDFGTHDMSVVDFDHIPPNTVTRL